MSSIIDKAKDALTQHNGKTYTPTPSRKSKPSPP
jgi:hypothetical protein